MTNPRTMRAVMVTSHGGPEVVKVTAAPVPQPRDDEVLIRVAALTFNPVELAFRVGALQGLFPLATPYIPGVDVSGTIEAVGSRVAGLRSGQAVYGFLDMTSQGSAAEYVTVKAEDLALAPQSIPLSDAAALAIPGLTSWQGLFELGGLKPEQTVLIVGASGGVGLVAVQLAKQAGVRVIATGASRSLDLLRGLGADEVFDYESRDWATRLKEKVDVVLNLAPGSSETVTGLLGLIKSGGIFVSAVAPADPQIAATLGVQAVRMGTRRDAALLKQISDRVDAGGLRPVISRRLRLEDVPSLHRDAGSDSKGGKVLIEVA